MIKAILISLGASLSLVVSAFPYGAAGHQIVGQIADEKLAGTPTGKAVTAYLDGMTLEKTQTDGFYASASKAAKTILETVEKDGFIQVFSHLDADGIAAAGIIGKALWRLDARFRIRVLQWVDDKIIGEIIAGKPQLVVLTDFGSGYLDLLNEKASGVKVVILDHHQIVGNAVNEGFVQVNPHLHGIDGATDVSGSGVAYFAAKALDLQNVDLSPIAIVGALGDMQD